MGCNSINLDIYKCYDSFKCFILEMFNYKYKKILVSFLGSHFDQLKYYNKKIVSDKLIKSMFLLNTIQRIFNNRFSIIVNISRTLVYWTLKLKNSRFYLNYISYTIA